MGLLTSIQRPNNVSTGYTYDNRYLRDEFTAYGDVVLESDGLNTPQLSYTMAAGQLISQTNHDTVNAGTHYYLSDIQGSTYELIDENGVIESYRYDAFGELLEQPSGDLTTDYLYTGEHYDALTESYNLRARHYMPGLGRFTGRDPHPYNLHNPFELNRYVYTANNPVMFSDPSGLYVGTRSLGGISAGAAPAAKSTGITITISYEHLVLALGAVAMPNLDDLFDDPTREEESEFEKELDEAIETSYSNNPDIDGQDDYEEEPLPLPEEEGVPPVVDVDVEEDEEEEYDLRFYRGTDESRVFEPRVWLWVSGKLEDALFYAETDPNLKPGSGNKPVIAVYKMKSSDFNRHRSLGNILIPSEHRKARGGRRYPPGSLVPSTVHEKLKSGELSINLSFGSDGREYAMNPSAQVDLKFIVFFRV